MHRFAMSNTCLALLSTAALGIVYSQGVCDTAVARVEASPEVTGRPAPGAAADTLTLVSRLALPEGVNAGHPLYPVVRKMWAGDFGEQPAWRLSLICQGLKHEPLSAKVTAYALRNPATGPRTRWGTRVRHGICAADPRYWGPGSVIWIGEPIERMMIVEDTGGAVKGPHRFDACFGSDVAACWRFGVQRIQYIPLYRAPVTHRWSSKPADWEPPAPPISQWLAPVPPAPVAPAPQVQVAAQQECG